MNPLGLLRRATRRLRARVEGRALVLMYHRVAEPASDPWGLAVSPRHFAEHLDVLRRHARVVGFGALGEAVRAGRTPRRAVAITFDDGYADNLFGARPLLERAGTPATVFFTTGSVGSTREFWWDELDRLLLQPNTLPSTLPATLSGTPHASANEPDTPYVLGDAARYTDDQALRHRAWRAWEAAPTARHAAYYALWKGLYPLPEAARQDALAALRAWAGAPPAARDTHRAVTPAEAVALADGRLIEGGAHTVTHVPLSEHAPAVQRAEIVRSKATLEALLGRPVTTFAYPHGAHDAGTVALTREAGFRAACTTTPAPVTRRSDALALPRFAVADEDGEAFARRLHAWWAA